MNEKTIQLKDLSVERVDGVDRPATGRKFLLLKSEDGGSKAIMKGYAMTATAASAVLKAVRANAATMKLSKSTMVAMNGLAQVLGADAVFKDVPTQPYEFTEPDADKRGPADESLGDITPLSMVGKGLTVTMKADAAAAAADPAEPDADDAKKKPEQMMPWEKAAKAQGEQIAELTKAVGALVAVAKGEFEDLTKSETVKPAKPASRQVQVDEPSARVEKAGRVSFADVLLGGK
jgi:hypothetical protein